MPRTISSQISGPVVLGPTDNPLTITATGTVASTGSSDGIDGEAELRGRSPIREWSPPPGRWSLIGWRRRHQQHRSVSGNDGLVLRAAAM